MKKKIIVGIDEVGRGPLAGPVSVGIAVLLSGVVPPGVRDSKQLTEGAREAVYGLAQELVEAGELVFGVYSVPASSIDTWGIERAIATAIARGMTGLSLSPQQVTLKLDGRLKAPPEFSQETIIRGDALVPAISLASVVAKVERDRYMVRVAHKKYPHYGFDVHKGYGTRAHREALQQHGPSPLHRRSFIRNIVIASSHV